MEYNFSTEEIEVMRENMSKIKTHIPENLTRWVWNTYRKINNSNEKQPCSCGSSANLWRKAVTTINNFLKEYDSK